MIRCDPNENPCGKRCIPKKEKCRSGALRSAHVRKRVTTDISMSSEPGTDVRKVGLRFRKYPKKSESSEEKDMYRKRRNDSRSRRYDALKCGPGNKPCGKRCIPQEQKCRSTGGSLATAGSVFGSLAGAGLAGFQSGRSARQQPPLPPIAQGANRGARAKQFAKKVGKATAAKAGQVAGVRIGLELGAVGIGVGARAAARRAKRNREARGVGVRKDPYVNTQEANVYQQRLNPGKPQPKAGDGRSPAAPNRNVGLNPREATGAAPVPNIARKGGALVVRGSKGKAPTAPTAIVKRKAGQSQLINPRSPRERIIKAFNAVKTRVGREFNQQELSGRAAKATERRKAVVNKIKAQASEKYQEAISTEKAEERGRKLARVVQNIKQKTRRKRK